MPPARSRLRELSGLTRTSQVWTRYGWIRPEPRTRHGLRRAFFVEKTAR